MSVQHVQLIHPPHYESTEDRLDPPMGLLFILAHLRKHHSDIRVTVNDLSGMAENQWDIAFADVYGLTVYAPSFHTVKAIIARCRQKNPRAKIVVGGAHPSAVPHIFQDHTDYIVIGPGETGMSKILASLQSGSDGLPQIVRNNAATEFLFPAYDAVDLHSYRRTIGGVPSVPLLTTKGCPYRCTFCGLTAMHELDRLRYAAPEVVHEHFVRLMEMGWEAFNIEDDIFLMGKKRSKEIVRLIEPLGITFRCHAKAGLDTRETYELLARAGCKMMAFGCETGSPYILERMRKDQTIQDSYNVIQWAREFGITSRAFFIIGFPGETRETMEETKRFIEWARPDQIMVSNFVPYAGTPIWENPKAFGIVRMEVDDFSQYFQVNEKGEGGAAIDTEWLSAAEFKELELEFRQWVKDNFKMKGGLLDYEKALYGQNGS